MLLTRDQILKCEDIQVEKVDIPEWGGYVFVKGMSGKERGQLEASMSLMKGAYKEDNWKLYRAKLLVLTVVDSETNGNRIFSEDDVNALNEKSAAVLDRLTDVAQRLSGYRKQDVEEITKN